MSSSSFSDEIRELVSTLKDHDARERAADLEFLDGWQNERKRVARLMTEACSALKQEWKVTAYQESKGWQERMVVGIEADPMRTSTLTVAPVSGGRELASSASTTRGSLKSYFTTGSFGIGDLSDGMIQGKIKEFISAVMSNETDQRDSRI